MAVTNIETASADLTQYPDVLALCKPALDFLPRFANLKLTEVTPQTLIFLLEISLILHLLDTPNHPIFKFLNVEIDKRNLRGKRYSAYPRGTSSKTNGLIWLESTGAGNIDKLIKGEAYTRARTIFRRLVTLSDQTRLSYIGNFIAPYTKERNRLIEEIETRLILLMEHGVAHNREDDYILLPVLRSGIDKALGGNFLPVSTRFKIPVTPNQVTERTTKSTPVSPIFTQKTSEDPMFQSLDLTIQELETLGKRVCV